MTASAIEVIDLGKHYGDREVVRGVSFAVAPGELVALVGGSGSGKTTILKTLNRLVEPSRGQVLVDGENTSAVDPVTLRRRIGYVFQGIGLFPHFSVEENIAVTPALLGWDAERQRRRVTELLELVELEPALRTRFPSELSGGQQQRVGVARALAAEPRFMLLDEPFGALDPLTRDRLQQSFAAIREKLALTAVFVTHDMSEALMLADRIAVLDDGRLLQLGTPRELVSAPANEIVERLIDTPRRQVRLLDEKLSMGPS
ncbi:MAG TPA: ABC transporter ATP-binding protein [Polyangiaceae bacterium]|nr:ABC transporter ATP-binding protein [Polyangiaceae bacterium]